MQNIKIKRREIDYSSFVKRPAKDDDFEELITQDCTIYDEAEPERPLILYFKFTEDTSEVKQAVQTIPYETNKRSGGLVSTSRIFGFDPRTGIRKPFCSSTRLAMKNPKEHRAIVGFGERIAEIYKQYLPGVYTSHEQIANEKIKQEWKIRGTPFTSGIINKNNQLNYHFDSGNFNNVYSNMIVFKSNSSGGYLSIPEFGIGLQCGDNTLVMFDGQKIMHGVTPIKMFTSKAYRYSIVYYTLKSFWKCEELNDELALVRNRRMRQERNNVKNV